MKKINESFICIECKKEVSPAPKTCRNHCPYCFTSLHVDGDIPGDRNTSCRGVMKPIQMKIANGKTKLLFLCVTCQKEHWNKLAEDDDRDILIDIIQNTKETLLYL